MGATHSLVPNRCWDDESDNSVGHDRGNHGATDDCDEADAHAVMASFTAAMASICRAPWIDVDAQMIVVASEAEYKHNQEAVYEAIAGLPSDCSFCIGIVCRCDDDDEARTILGIDVECRGGNRYSVITSGPTSRGWPVWSARLMARAVSALSLSHVVYMVPTSSSRSVLLPPVESRFVGLRDRMWVSTMVRGLLSGPITGGWTGDSVVQMRLVISLLERATTQRIQNAQEPMWLDTAITACATSTRDAARCLCESDHVVSARGPFAESCLDHVAGLERNLRWMATWLDALARTPATSQHLAPRAFV